MADENSSVGPPRRELTNSVEGAGRGIGVISSHNMGRDRSGRRFREGDDSVSNVDAISIGSRGVPATSPARGVFAEQYTNRTNQ